jgi:hypothetical protein
MNTLAITFPHATLTKIDDRPNNASLQQLKKEIYTNARAIYSPLGGGDNGHLALVMGSAAYQLRSGTAWIDPAHPGEQPPHDGNATQALIVATNRLYDNQVTGFQTFTTVRNLLQKQLLDAINNTYFSALEDRLFGYDDVTPHLQTTYGTLTIDDLKNNRKRLSATWNPDDPIETLWARLKTCQDYASGTTEEITDDTAMRLTLRAIEATGILSSDCASWRKKPAAKRTLANFKLLFSAADDERRRQLTATTAGFHGAHRADTEEPKAPCPHHERANLANRTTETPAAHIELPSGKKMYYCWSHGLGTNRAHTSVNCLNKKDGHKDNATADHMLGGCDIIMKPRPRRSS